jgi:hypothetical protein
MMSALGELGRTGLTAVGNSHEEAKVTYDRAVAVLDEKTRDGAGRNDEIRRVRSESIGELTKLPGRHLAFSLRHSFVILTSSCRCIHVIRGSDFS